MKVLFHPALIVCLRPSQVSLVKSEETKVRQEDLSKLLYEVQLLRTQQDNMECQMQDMKQWVDSVHFTFISIYLVNNLMDKYVQNNKPKEQLLKM